MPVFLFPGQGAQFSGMGMDLYNADANGSLGIRALFDTASSVLSRDIKEILNSDDEILKRTDISQPAITVVSLAAALYLQNRQVVPLACAGFSLGEFPALAISGVITLEDAIRLTAERGKIMQAACDSLLEKSSVPPGMMAVLGLSPEQIDLVLAGFSDADLYAANYNSPKQTVISGTANALSLAEEEFKKAGAKRVIRLKVSGPFHSPLMQDAANKFSQVLDGFKFADPVLPLFSNVTGGRVASGTEAKKNAVLHISNPVRWTTEEVAIASLMAEKSEDTLIEVGPGKVLTGLWRDSGQSGSSVPYTDYIQAPA
jgi:[acyl-carrier-protein] S-malonyltransferase